MADKKKLTPSKAFSPAVAAWREKKAIPKRATQGSPQPAVKAGEVCPRCGKGRMESDGLL